jgi:hypothetical protein
MFYREVLCRNLWEKAKEAFCLALINFITCFLETLGGGEANAGRRAADDECFHK